MIKNLKVTIFKRKFSVSSLCVRFYLLSSQKKRSEAKKWIIYHSYTNEFGLTNDNEIFCSKTWEKKLIKMYVKGVNNALEKMTITNYMIT